MNSFLCGLMCTYAFIKHLFGCTADFQQSNRLKTFPLRCLVVAATLFAFTLIVVLLLVLFILHHLVDTYLRIKHGPAFGGMLKRQDAGLMSLPDVVGRIVFILNQDKDQSDVWRSCLKNARKFHSSSYKLSSHVESCLGYAYYLKDQTKFEDVVEEVAIGNGDCITKEELLDYINDVLRTKHDEKRLWSLRYFAQPISWNHKSKTTKQYACIFSFNHCLSDGPHMMKLMMEFLMDKGPYEPPRSNVLIKNVKSTSKLSIDDAYYISVNPLYRSIEGFPKLNENPGDDAYTAIHSEDTEKYLRLIKQVKTKIGVGFNSVLMGALCGSLTDYLKKKNKPPMDLTVINVVRPEEIKLVFKNNDEDPLFNDVGHQTIVVPAEQVNLDTSTRLQAIDESLEIVRRSLDSTLVYTSSKYSHLLPSVLQRLALWGASRNRSSVISNMSGLKNLSYGGHPVEAVLFFVPNMEPAFVSLITTLDGRLQMTLHARGLYVSNRKELQDILDETLRSIDKFAKELQIE